MSIQSDFHKENWNWRKKKKNTLHLSFQYCFLQLILGIVMKIACIIEIYFHILRIDYAKIYSYV